MSNTCVVVDSDTNWTGLGGVLVGDTGFGVLGSEVPSTGDDGPGYAYADLPASSSAKQVCGKITTWPQFGTLDADETTGFTYTRTSAGSGTDSFSYQLYLDGAASGSPITKTLSATATMATAPVSADLVLSYVIRKAVHADLQLAYMINSAPGTLPSGPVTVPTSRTAKFVGHPRVAVFKDTGPVTLTKVCADQLYFVGDFTTPLAEGATTAASVMAVPSNVDVLEGPVIQGSLMLVKLGTLDPAGGQFTFRVTCANGEVIDGTIILDPLDDRSQAFGKDPDDRRYYAFDVSADLALSTNTSIATVQAPATNGVTALSAPAVQGGKIFVLIGGLDQSDGAANSCKLTMTLATGEVINRTIYFSRKDH